VAVACANAPPNADAVAASDVAAKPQHARPVVRRDRRSLSIPHHRAAPVRPRPEAEYSRLSQLHSAFPSRNAARPAECPRPSHSRPHAPNIAHKPMAGGRVPARVPAPSRCCLRCWVLVRRRRRRFQRYDELAGCARATLGRGVVTKTENTRYII
jgi:hypothetical protein